MWKKIIGYTLLTIVVLVGAGAAYLFLRQPDRRAPVSIQVDMSPARVERGQYVYTLADCDGCHSEHDWHRANGPVIRKASGQVLAEEGLTVYIPNITPDKETGLGNWTDGEKIRAIREGIGKDNQALFPMMPYGHFRYMSDDDVQSLVAYLNTLPPIQNKLPRTQLPFPVNVLIKGAPRPVTEPVATPLKESKRVYGEYLATLGLCEECHTQADKGELNLAMRFAGGRKFSIKSEKGPLLVLSANITPDKDTGIGTWDFARFKERIRRHQEDTEKGNPKIGPELFTIMPWENLAHITDEDLQLIFDYLKEQPAIPNKVVPHPGAPVQNTASLQ